MISVQYPPYDFRIKTVDNKDVIFCMTRKQWLVLTPEEWVRQNFAQVLLQLQQVPASYIAMEKELMLGDLKKRFDILVYDRTHKPWLMVECKSPEVPLDDKVLHQILRYNQQMQVSFIIITNGSSTACFKLKPDFKQIDVLPLFI